MSQDTTTVLITGANRGLGLEFARQYLADGWKVIATCRTPAKANALQDLAKANKNLRIEALETGEAKSIAALAGRLTDATIDLLINNAGIFSGVNPEASAMTGDKAQAFGDIDAEAWDKVLRINTIAPVMMIQAFMPHLLRAHEPKIANITSRMGSISRTLESGGGALAYRSSKAALNSAIASITQDLAAHNIIVANFHPGWVKTDMGGAAADLTPTDSITGMRKVIADLTQAQSGSFLDYKGDIVSW